MNYTSHDENFDEMIDEIAAVFWFLEDYVCQFDPWYKENGVKGREYDNFDKARRVFLNMVKDFCYTPHSGDCQDQPWTCYRCLLEDYRAKALDWWVKYNG